MPSQGGKNHTQLTMDQKQRIPSLLPGSSLKLDPFPNPDPNLIKTYNDLIQICLPQLKSQTYNTITPNKPTDLYKFGPKVGQGQYGTVYKCQTQTQDKKKKKVLVAVKKLSKHGYSNNHVAIFGMNQILRQMDRWKSWGIETNWSSDEIVMVLNLIKIQWEIVIMNRLNQMGGRDNIVRFIHCLDYNASPYVWLVYEWCNLGELQWQRDRVDDVPSQWRDLLDHQSNKWFRQNGVNVESFSLKILKDVSKGLQFLQRCQIIHRDIKPANLLIDGINGLVKISDYGCSIIEPMKSDIFDYKKYGISSKTVQECYQREINKIVGTPAFIPPELCQFNNLVNNHHDSIINGYKIDIWALGIILYCLIFNELPFSGENEFATYHQITSKDLRNNIKNNNHPLIQLIIKRLLDKNPQNRIDIETLIEECGKLIPSSSSSSSLQDKKRVKNKSVKSFFNKLLNRKNKNNNSSSNSKTNAFPSTKELDSKIEDNDIFVKTNEDIYSEEFSLESSFEEPVLVTDPLDILSGPNRINLNDEIAELDGLRDTHSLSETEIRSSISPQKQSTRRGTLVSSASLEIITPIKKLIRINNTPEKKLEGSSDKSLGSNRLQFNSNRIPPSSNIINFKTMLPPNEQGSTDTVEDIKNYLSYGDN